MLDYARRVLIVGDESYKGNIDNLRKLLKRLKDAAIWHFNDTGVSTMIEKTAIELGLNSCTFTSSQKQFSADIKKYYQFCKL